MTDDAPHTAASVGSVFLRTSNPSLTLAALRPLFADAPERPTTEGWVDIPGSVDIFVEPVAESAVPVSAGFGIRVPDAGESARRLGTVPGLQVSDIFEVAAGCSAFHVLGAGVPELFIHE